MRLSRVRFTIRRLMAVVAVAAIGLAAWRLVRLRDDYLDHAVRHGCSVVALGELQQLMEDQIDVFSRYIQHKRKLAKIQQDPFPIKSLPSPEELDLEIKEVQKKVDKFSAYLARYARMAEHYPRLKLKYERASRYPWLTVEPDPPVPK